MLQSPTERKWKHPLTFPGPTHFLYISHHRKVTTWGWNYMATTWNLLPLYLSLLFLKSLDWKFTDWKLWNSSHQELDLYDCQKTMSPGFHLLNQMVLCVYSSRNLSTSPQAVVQPCPPLYIHTHADTPLKNHVPSEVRVHCKYSSSRTCPLITWEPHFYSTVRKPPFPLFCVDGVSVRISAELCRSEWEIWELPGQSLVIASI